MHTYYNNKIPGQNMIERKHTVCTVQYVSPNSLMIQQEIWHQFYQFHFELLLMACANTEHLKSHGIITSSIHLLHTHRHMYNALSHSSLLLKTPTQRHFPVGGKDSCSESYICFISWVKQGNRIMSNSRRIQGKSLQATCTHEEFLT